MTQVAHHWLVSDSALIKKILTDAEAFPPHNALDAVTPMSSGALAALVQSGFRLPPTLANNASTSHAALREIVGHALNPRNLATQRAWLTGMVRRKMVSLQAALRAGASVDIYAELAAELPLRVLARLVQLPDDDAIVVKQFSRRALELFWGPLDVDRQQELAKLVGQYHHRLRVFVRNAGGLPGQLRERGYSEDVVVAVVFFLLVAGQETTSQFLGLLLHRLLREHSVVEALIKGAVSSVDVVEEGLRLEPPIVTWRRTNAHLVHLDGHAVPAGSSIVLCLADAGMDVEESHTFSPGRPGSRRHLAFGAGAHRCLGAQLSRMEADVVVSEVAPLLRAARIVQPPSYPDNLSFRMPDSLVIASRVP